MKLIYLSELRLPTKNAHGFQIMNMCSAFVSNGVEVTLLVPRRFNLLKEDAFDFYHLTPNFTIKKLPAIDLYPLRLIPESISGFVSLLTFLISARIYLSFCKYDTLFTRENLARFFFKNYVYEIHMPEQMRAGGFKPKKIIAISNYIKNKLKESRVQEENVLVAPDAVNLSLFKGMGKEEARRRLGFPLNKPIVLYWGNFKKWKGVDTLAEAVVLLPETFVVMIGATKESDLLRIRKKVESLSNVLVDGFKPQEQLPTHLASADALILPNSAHDENSRLYTSPLKLFEYMAAERPIVASDLPSIREILNDRNAVFFKPDSPESLSAAIQTLISQPELQKKLARQARQDVGEYTWDKRARKIIDFINHR